MYCLKCKKQTDTNNTQISCTKNGKPRLTGTCAICNKPKSCFIKKEEVASYEKEIVGGFLPLAFIPALIAAGKAAAAAAALGAAGAVGAKIANKAMGQGLYLHPKP